MLYNERDIVNYIKSMFSTMTSTQYGALCFLANNINTRKLPYNSLAIAYILKPMFDNSFISTYTYKEEPYYALTIGDTFIRHLLEESTPEQYTACISDIPAPANVFKKDRQYKVLKSLLMEMTEATRVCCHCSKEHSIIYYWNAYHAACYDCEPEPPKKQPGKPNPKKFLQTLNGRLARLGKAENVVEEATKLLQDLMINKDELKRYIDVDNLIERVQEGFRQHS